MKHYKFVTITLFLSMLCGSFVLTNAQIKSKITGALIDSLTSQPVPFANIVLSEELKSFPINGTTSQTNGLFSIDGVSPGKYFIIFSFVGYIPKKITLQIEEKTETNLGIIKLNPEVNKLNEIVVTGQKNVVEQKVDRLVYNPENSISASGGDATDVLKNVPLLAVDANGNLYLKGSQNIKLLVNDKPSSMAATSISDALKQIPADIIKSVEVMTSPPAKYDAEGSAGVVNIILKKSTELASLSSNGSFEVRGSKITLNGNVRKGKMTYGGNVFQNYSYNHPGSVTNSQTTDPGNASSTIFQHVATNYSSYRQSYTFNWDYDINAKNYISSFVTANTRADNSVQNGQHTWNEAGDISLKNIKTDGGANSVDANLTYSHLFKKPKRELTLMSLYTMSDNSSNFNTAFLNTSDYSNSGYQKNINTYSNKEITFQADYQTPINNNLLIEAGAKNIMRDVSVQYQYFNAASDNQFVLILNPSLTNNLHYIQNVRAAYLSYTWSIVKNYDVKAGLRYEDTFIEANFGDQQKISIPSYSVVVPSFNFLRKLAQGDLKLSYNRRIQRPSVQYLNPNLVATNALNVTIGNPGLSPEFTDNYDLSYSTSFKSVSLDLSGYLKSTNNAIQTVKKPLGSDTISTTYKNTGKQNVFGFDIYSTVSLSKKLSLTSDINSFYTIAEGDDPGQVKTIRNEGMSYFVSLIGRYKVNSKVRIELNGFNFGNTYFLQGHQQGWSIFNLSVKKDLADKRGSVGFTAGNFIPGYIKMKSTFDSPYFHQQSVNEVKNLNFKIFFAYQLIKPKANEETKSRKSIKNDDLKTGSANVQN